MKNLAKTEKNRESRAAAQPASALIMTMFILAGMMMVAFSGAYVVMVGLKSAGVQADSTKAYFVAEGGAERTLWQLRKGGWNRPDPDPAAVQFSGALPAGGSFEVYYTHYNYPMIFKSIGTFGQTKRSVELRM